MYLVEQAYLGEARILYGNPLEVLDHFSILRPDDMFDLFTQSAMWLTRNIFLKG